MKKKIKLIFIFITVFLSNLYSQTNDDSLVLVSDIKFHSEFEKQSFKNFFENKTDTFNLLLAIDQNVTAENAKTYFDIYQSVYEDFTTKKIKSKDLDKEIKLAYTIVHEKFLKKYNEIEFLPSTFKYGTYNCASASVLYALVFDHLKIPYKIMLSSNHVYLIANPGTKQIVIETTNPNVEKAIFNDKFVKQFVKSLKDSKLISEDEYVRKSVSEIYEENLNRVHEIDFRCLAGVQYHNLALSKFLGKDVKLSYELLQKAYFFLKDPQVKLFLFAALIDLIQSCNFSNVSDIDYLAQLSRFKNEDVFIVPKMFYQILSNYLQYSDKDLYCDSLYKRLILQISNKQIKNEVSFVYYAQLSNAYRTSDKLEFYAYQALKIKPNHRDALQSFEHAMQKKFEQIHDNQQLLDTILVLKQRYDIEVVKKLFSEYEMMAYLGIAFDYYKKKQPDIGETYIEKFEKVCSLPFTNRELLIKIVDAYRVKAEYYSNKSKTKEKEALEKGLKYVPNSSILKALMEEKGYNH